MANSYDVDARLGEGRPAIDDVEEYVAACRRLGYQHRDLTMHVTQVRDWYGGEEGMDLQALDTDHATLAAAAAAAEEAARCQVDLASVLSSAWSGGGSAAAQQFFWRTGQSASAVSAAVRTAADAVATLRDALWHAVDGKVVATETVGDRSAAHRAEWLTAAKTVTTGAGDLATASELVESQVKPFVDVEVGSNWLTGVRTAIATIDAAYDAALSDLASAPRATFGVPGDLGPRPAGYVGETGARDVAMAPVHTMSEASAPGPVAPAPAPVTPASWSGPPAPPAPMPLAEAAPSLPATLPAAAQPMPSMPSVGELGAGTSTLGSGLSGFGQQLADLIGSLAGSGDQALPGADELTDPTDPTDPVDETADDDPTHDDPTDEDPEATDDAEDAAPVEESKDPGEAIAETPAAEPLPAAEPVSTPAPAPLEMPPPVPIADTPPEAAEPTPCEIAADELPQVGE